MKIDGGYELYFTIPYRRRYYTFDGIEGPVYDFTFTGKFKILEGGDCWFEVKYTDIKRIPTKEHVIDKKKLFWLFNYEVVREIMVVEEQNYERTRWIRDDDFSFVYFGNCGEVNE